jgi:tetratricopeptide (TPR) repeat protein
MSMDTTIKRLICRQFFIGSLVLVAGIVAVYGQVVHFSFTDFDDPNFVFENPMVKEGLTVQGIFWAWGTGYYDFWHPLTWWSHMLDCELFGLDAGYHHLVNVFWHGANSIALFGLLAGMTGKWFRSFLVAALFALHPVHVESVAWVSERKDVLSTFFGLLTLVAYWLYVRTDSLAANRQRWFYRLSLIFFALGLMAKAMLVTLPFVLLLMDFWPLERIARDRLDAANLKTLLKEKLPYFALALASCFMTYHTMSEGGNIAAGEKVPLESRLENVPISYARYLLKLFWPTNLAAYYPLPKEWEAWRIAISVIFLVGVSWLVLKQRNRFPYLFWGWCFFGGALVPVIGIVANGFQAIADRYDYIPSIGILVAVTWGFADLLGNRIGQSACGVLCAVLLGILGWMSWRQTEVWQNSFTLWNHCLQVTDDSATAENNLGYAYWCDGKAGLAIKHYEAAVSMQPNLVVANVNLGVAKLDAGNYGEATNCFGRALAVMPEMFVPNFDMALAAMKAKDFNAAEKYSQKAAELQPSDAQSWLALGKAQAALNQHEPAVKSFQQALRFDSGNAEAYFLLGKECGSLGNYDEEIASLSQAITLRPNWVEAHVELAQAFTDIGQKQQAIQQYELAVGLDPDFAPALNNLSWVLGTSSKPDLRNGQRAVELAEKACKLTQYQEALYIGTLAAAYAEAGKFELAVSTAQKAREVALAHGQQDVADSNAKLLKIYQTGRAFHQETQQPSQ